MITTTVAQRLGYPLWRVLLRALPLLVGAAFLMSCGPSKAQQEAPNVRAKPQPGADDLREATNPGYVTPTGQKQECLGRLIFDLPQGMEWGLKERGWDENGFGFTNEIRSKGEHIRIGGLRVMIFAAADEELQRGLVRSVVARKANGIREYEKRNATRRDLIQHLEKNENKEDPASVRAAITDFTKMIADDEASIASMEQHWHPIDVGRPGALGYAAGPSLYAFLLNDGRAFEFRSTSSTGGPSFEERLPLFLAAVKNFQFRKLHEIPQQRGVCIPFGFFPDDGTHPFDIEMSLRYADRPGVIYTVATATVGELGSEPSAFKAAARASAGLLGAIAADAGPRRMRSIGPKGARIGALPAEQGGVSFNVADAGKPVIENYSVYTGYGGWGGSAVLPAIVVDMRSFTKEQERALKKNPPPLDESLQRLDALLKSIRLRPTTPPMPELDRLPVEQKRP